MSTTSNQVSRLGERTIETASTGRFSRIAPWVNRLILLWPTVVLTFVGLRGVLHPVEFGMQEGIFFQSSQGIAIGRVAMGAFPLASVFFSLWCLTSRRRIATGLSFIAIVMAVAIVVRALGILWDHALGRNLALLVVAAVILALCLFGANARPRHGLYPS